MSNEKLPRLKISDNGRFLSKEDGSPFFWLGDTAWELFHKLTREDAEVYFSHRAELGFTVIQAVGLAEFEGITTVNAYGRLPLKLDEYGNPDPALPDEEGDYDYWSHVDFIVDVAASYGLYIAFLPTWGDKYHKAWGKGPEVFTSEKARSYGRWLGQRYRSTTNIVWVMGGDRALTTRKHVEIIHAMAEGLAEGDGGSHLRTFHPPGEKSSSCFVHEEDWLDFNMIQSGHRSTGRANYAMLELDYAMQPIKPTLDGEPCYEDHPVSFDAGYGYYNDADVRTAAYYAVFSGAFGHTYGHHSIWSMTNEPGDYFIMDWRSALTRPGATQMRHLRSLIEARSFFDRVPDQRLIANQRTGANYMVATRGEQYAMIYIPNGLCVEVAKEVILSDRVTAAWFNPRSGVWKELGLFTTDEGLQFQPPSSGRGEDWVLVLDWHVQEM